MLTVADGVSSWAAKGVDPAILARKLTEVIIEDHLADPTSSAKSNIIKGCSDAIDYSLGSATAVAAKIRNDQWLEISTLGDSGMMLFRVLKGDRLLFVFETKPF